MAARITSPATVTTATATAAAPHQAAPTPAKHRQQPTNPEANTAHPVPTAPGPQERTPPTDQQANTAPQPQANTAAQQVTNINNTVPRHQANTTPQAANNTPPTAQAAAQVTTTPPATNSRTAAQHRANSLITRAMAAATEAELIISRRTSIPLPRNTSRVTTARRRIRSRVNSIPRLRRRVLGMVSLVLMVPLVEMVSMVVMGIRLVMGGRVSRRNLDGRLLMLVEVSCRERREVGMELKMLGLKLS